MNCSNLVEARGFDQLSVLKAVAVLNELLHFRGSPAYGFQHDGVSMQIQFEDTSRAVSPSRISASRHCFADAAASSLVLLILKYR